MILLLFLFSSMTMMPIRHSRRTFLDVAFIQNAKSFWWTSPTPTFPMSFTVGDGSHCVMSWSLVLSCLSRSFTPTCTRLIVRYLFSSLAFEVCAFLSHRSLLWMCFEFLGQSSLTTLVVSICRLCPRMSSNLLFVSVIPSGVSANSLTVRALQKALGF